MYELQQPLVDNSRLSIRFIDPTEANWPARSVCAATEFLLPASLAFFERT
jgi:hypothetical protein